MEENAVFHNEYMKIFIGSDGVYIETYKKGFPIQQLPSILQQHPEIGVTNLDILRNAVVFAPRKPEKFGEYRGRISISMPPDEITATITFNMSEEELSLNRRAALIKEVYTELDKKGIVFGVKMEILTSQLESGRPYLIAQGIPPVNGNDAVIKMYELKDSKPDVTEDGKVDLYELKLINRVKAGDWLGERIDATEGAPGRSVRGIEVKQTKGRSYNLNYDKNTIIEMHGGNKTILYARINGAANYDNGRINVSDYLEIAGDIGVGTGNIKFDGYVTIKGTICDGFSLEATRDIEINGDLGLGNIKSIISTGGSVYIKGGISSKGGSEIRAAKNIFTKFSDNADIICGKSAHIGYYCINSNVEAAQVIMDSSKGQIIGGSIKAQVRVSSPLIGSAAEKKTVIEVTGFSRQAFIENLESIFRRISELKSEQMKLKLLLSSGEETSKSDQFQKKDYMDNCEKLYNVKEELKELEEERKNTAEYLKAKGEGEITISKKVFPNCTLVIRQCVTEITSALSSVTFYIQDGQIKQL